MGSFAATCGVLAGARAPGGSAGGVVTPPWRSQPRLFQAPAAQTPAQPPAQPPAGAGCCTQQQPAALQPAPFPPAPPAPAFQFVPLQFAPVQWQALAGPQPLPSPPPVQQWIPSQTPAQPPAQTPAQPPVQHTQQAQQWSAPQHPPQPPAQQPQPPQQFVQTTVGQAPQTTATQHAQTMFVPAPLPQPQTPSAAVPHVGVPVPVQLVSRPPAAGYSSHAQTTRSVPPPERSEIAKKMPNSIFAELKLPIFLPQKFQENFKIRVVGKVLIWNFEVRFRPNFM